MINKMFELIIIVVKLLLADRKFMLNVRRSSKL